MGTREITAVAAGRIGRFPGGKSARAVALAGGTVAGSPSYRHAQDAWTSAVVVAARECARAQRATLAELAMSAALASHLGACERCWRTGPYDARTPAQWLMWAVARRPGIAEVVGPVLADVAGSRLDRSLGSLG